MQDDTTQTIDVNDDFKKEILKNKKALGLAAAGAVAWVFLLINFAQNIIASDLGILAVILPWSIILIWVYALYLKANEDFWKQLAAKYNWQFTTGKDISHERALLFGMGHSRSASYGLEGKYNNQPFNIFEYAYIVGEGKSKRIFSFTVFEVKFTGTFPQLYLNYKADWYSNPPPMFTSIAQIPVPKEFGDVFKLYAPKEYEVETLEIFTPELFAQLLDSKWNHDMEFVNGELVIYTREQFENFASLDAELNKVKKLIDILAPLLNKLKLTQIGDYSSSL